MTVIDLSTVHCDWQSLEVKSDVKAYGIKNFYGFGISNSIGSGLAIQAVHNLALEFTVQD